MKKTIEIRKDLLGNTPEIGNLIVFNPPAYKGLVIGRVIEYSNTGLPVCGQFFDERGTCSHYGNRLTFVNSDGTQNYDYVVFERWSAQRYTPKTGFIVVYPNPNSEIIK